MNKTKETKEKSDESVTYLSIEHEFKDTNLREETKKPIVYNGKNQWDRLRYRDRDEDKFKQKRKEIK